MLERGAGGVRLLEEIVEKKPMSYRLTIKLLEDGIFSFTWRTDEAGRKRGADALRAHVASQGNSLDDMTVLEFPILWRVYEL
jgi:hypothetical protein